MVYITGDKHGDYERVFGFCYKNNTSKNDIMIVLGDAGINYYLDNKDYTLKNHLKELPITLFCIHGNHEERPYNIAGYKSKVFNNGIVYFESLGAGLSHPFFSRVIEAFKKQADNYGYSLLFGSKNNRLKNKTFLEYFKYVNVVYNTALCGRKVIYFLYYIKSYCT